MKGMPYERGGVESGLGERGKGQKGHGTTGNAIESQSLGEGVGQDSGGGWPNLKGRSVPLRERTFSRKGKNREDSINKLLKK